jgi:sugar lactone lactonase YvrE
LQIKTSTPEAIWKAKTLLGEGTLWVPSKSSIFFVDIKKKKILTFNLKTNKKKIIKLDKEIGFLSHIKKNIFILGLKSELRVVNLKTKKTLNSIKIEKDKAFNRLNDGKTDPVGRLWFGSMDNLERNIKNGSLYCLDKKLKLTKVDTKYIITNGPTFINEKKFYHTDSRKKNIYKITVNSKLKIIKKKYF